MNACSCTCVSARRCVTASNRERGDSTAGSSTALRSSRADTILASPLTRLSNGAATASQAISTSSHSACERRLFVTRKRKA